MHLLPRLTDPGLRGKMGPAGSPPWWRRGSGRGQDQALRQQSSGLCPARWASGSSEQEGHSSTRLRARGRVSSAGPGWVACMPLAAVFVPAAQGCDSHAKRCSLLPRSPGMTRVPTRLRSRASVAWGGARSVALPQPEPLGPLGFSPASPTSFLLQGLCTDCPLHLLSPSLHSSFSSNTDLKKGFPECSYQTAESFSGLFTWIFPQHLQFLVFCRPVHTGCLSVDGSTRRAGLLFIRHHIFSVQKQSWYREVSRTVC